jgi:hypothetical protein
MSDETKIAITAAFVMELVTVTAMALAIAMVRLRNV